MFCRNVRQKLSAFLQGELEARAANSVEAHLAQCSSCREEMAMIQVGIQMAELLPSVSAPSDLWLSIEEKIGKQKSQMERTYVHSLILRFALAFCIIAILSLAFLLFIRSRGNYSTVVKAALPVWSINATAIEACSCPMFCQCYFNTKPAAHHEHGKGETHYCRGNIAYRVNKGQYGSQSLKDIRFWLALDVGSDFSKGETLWAVLYFDPSVNRSQREAVQTILSELMPVKWKSFRTAEAKIDTWEVNNDSAYASLDAGKTAVIKLRRFQGITNEPVVIRNLRYWGAPRNEGFVMMPTEVQGYRHGPNAFEFKGTSGFLITFDMNSNDLLHKKDQVKRNSPKEIQPFS